VLIFYRGGWCPFCNDHLREIGQKETDILALGYQIVAVSPDKVEKLKDIEQMDDINYRLFSDSAGQLTRAAGIAFKAPERYTQRLLDWSDGKNTGFLPVPSLFVLDQKGEIQFEYINPKYKKRMSGELLLAVLKVLKEEGEE
jgi:peroxiredoxin